MRRASSSDARIGPLQTPTPLASSARSSSESGRPTAIAQGTAQSTTEYGTDGRVSKETDAELHATQYARDSLGRATTITAPDGTTTGLTWDAASQLTSLTAPDGRLFSYEYDDDGHVTTAVRGARSGSSETSLTSHASYDDHGRLHVATRPSGKTVTETYDAAGRLSKTEANDGTSATSHFEAVVDGKGGRLESVSTDDGSTTHLLHNGSLVTQITDDHDAWTGDTTGDQPSVSFEYDSALRPTSQSIGTDKVTYAYNDDDQVTSVGSTQFDYDATTGDGKSLTAGATKTSQTLDARGDLATLTTTADPGTGAASVLAESIVRDRVGRITQRTVADDSGTHVWAYTYDANGHLTQVTKDGVAVETYSYDSSGGLTSRGSGVLTSWIHTDGHGRPVSAADGTAAAWTADGELSSLTTTDGTSTFGYDGFGRLNQVTLPDGKIGRYRYDALGRRTAVRLDGTLVRRYVYGGSIWPQARIDAAGSVIERYVYGSQAHVPDLIVRRDGQRIRLVTDSVGSVRAAVEADTGVVLERLSYDAYGRTTQDTNPGLQPFGFKGALTDPVAQGAGLLWMGVRAYQPRLARFTTPDPEDLVAAWNEHDALGADPVNLADVDGWLPGWFETLTRRNAAFWDHLTMGGTEWLREQLWGQDALYCGYPDYDTAGTVGDITSAVAPIPGPGKGAAIAKAAADAEREAEAARVANQIRGRRPQSLPRTGTPNTSSSLDRGNGNGQIRDYGPDGEPVKDIDFGHDHGAGDPHVHDWEKGERQPGRPVGDGD